MEKKYTVTVSITPSNSSKVLELEFINLPEVPANITAKEVCGVFTTVIKEWLDKELPKVLGEV